MGAVEDKERWQCSGGGSELAGSGRAQAVRGVWRPSVRPSRGPFPMGKEEREREGGTEGNEYIILEICLWEGTKAVRSECTLPEHHLVSSYHYSICCLLWARYFFTHR